MKVASDPAQASPASQPVCKSENTTLTAAFFHSHQPFTASARECDLMVPLTEGGKHTRGMPSGGKQAPWRTSGMMSLTAVVTWSARRQSGAKRHSCALMEPVQRDRLTASFDCISQQRSQPRPGKVWPFHFRVRQQPLQTCSPLKCVHVSMLQQNPSIRLSIRLTRQTFGRRPEASNMCSIQKHGNTWMRAKTESGRVTETRGSTKGSAKSIPSRSRAAGKVTFVQH